MDEPFYGILPSPLKRRALPAEVSEISQLKTEIKLMRQEIAQLTLICNELLMRLSLLEVTSGR